MTPAPAPAPAPADPGTDLPLVLDEVEVVTATRLSPSFVRVELAGTCLAGLGVEGPWLDQRIKLVLPGAAGTLPRLAEHGPGWWQAWLALPEDERGAMRTYTVREVLGAGAGCRLVVDVVVHEPGGDADDGPGNRWARAAAPGDRVLLVAPRAGHDFGGREFDPGDADRLLLVGDETAVPAVAGILRDLAEDPAGAGAVGAALLEVPTSADVQRLRAPAGVEVVWLPRDGAPRGGRLHAETVARCGLVGARPDVPDAEVDPSVWDTPSLPAADRSGATGPADDDPQAGLYAWIAGEAKVVTALRRHLVRERGWDRRRVAFMGYWREGVPMRG